MHIGPASFGIENEKFFSPSTVGRIIGRIIFSTNAASGFIAKDVLPKMYCSSCGSVLSERLTQAVYLGYFTTIAKNIGESADIFELH